MKTYSLEKNQATQKPMNLEITASSVSVQTVEVLKNDDGSEIMRGQAIYKMLPLTATPATTAPGVADPLADAYKAALTTLTTAIEDAYFEFYKATSNK